MNSALRASRLRSSDPLSAPSAPNEIVVITPPPMFFKAEDFITHFESTFSENQTSPAYRRGRYEMATTIRAATMNKTSKLIRVIGIVGLVAMAIVALGLIQGEILKTSVIHDTTTSPKIGN
jgi:hypothetical protein